MLWNSCIWPKKNICLYVCLCPNTIKIKINSRPYVDMSGVNCNKDLKWAFNRTKKNVKGFGTNYLGFLRHTVRQPINEEKKMEEISNKYSTVFLPTYIFSLLFCGM